MAFLAAVPPPAPNSCIEATEIVGWSKERHRNYLRHAIELQLHVNRIRAVKQQHLFTDHRSAPIFHNSTFFAQHFDGWIAGKAAYLTSTLHACR